MFTVFQKRIEISENIQKYFSDIYHEELDDKSVLYFAETSGCDVSMNETELQTKIENAIIEELLILSNIPELVQDAKARGLL